MVHALFVLAAGEAEPSKLAFYLCGGALAVWAVVLAGVGLTRPSFPGTIAVTRGVITLTVVLMGAAMATAIITA